MILRRISLPSLQSFLSLARPESRRTIQVRTRADALFLPLLATAVTCSCTSLRHQYGSVNPMSLRSSCIDDGLIYE